MANYNGMVGNSGFSEPLTLDSKYYNLYTTNNINMACNNTECISHALSETSGWYNDYHNIIDETYPWMVRGGNYGTSSNSAGILGFYPSHIFGGVAADGSFRLVISPSI